MRNMNISGGTSPNGDRYIGFYPQDRRVWVLASNFSNPKSLKAVLQQNDVILADKKALDEFMKLVAEVHEFPQIELAEKVGWNGMHFLHADGEMVSPAGAQAPEIASTVQLNAGSIVRGMHRRWRKDVARRLDGNPLAIFSICLPFAAPLIHLSRLPILLAFELVGAQAIGKSTLQRLAVSVMGGTSLSAEEGFWATHLSASVNAQKLSASFADHALVLDSADDAFFGQTPKAKKDVYRAIAFDLAGQGHGGRQCVLSSSNEPLNQWLGSEAPAAAAKEHVLTLKLEADRPYGVFDRLPAGTPSAGDFAEELMRTIADHHGTAFRRYIKWLVAENEKDPKALRALIADRLETFRKNVGVDRNDGKARRRVDPFGFVYAAATLARESGALPKASRFTSRYYGQAIRQCYQLHLISVPAPVPFATRLRELVDDPRCLDANLPDKPTPEAIRNAPMILWRKSGVKELLVKVPFLHEAFPDWEASRRAGELSNGHSPDKDHPTKKRVVCGVDLSRVYVFKLPQEEAGQQGIFEV